MVVYMKVSMAEINKRANLIINQVSESGEVATIMKHGKPIAEIRPIPSQGVREDALAYLTALEPVKVEQPVEKVIKAGRRRGI
jgi:antitoxin (DNA-binding transcriptional repressor) of toxin-antitoxin stability system